MIKKDYLTIKNAANKSNLSVMTIYRKIKKGEIPFLRHGNKIVIKKQDFYDWLPKKNYLTIKNAANKSNLSVMTIYRLIKKGEIPHHICHGKIYIEEKDFYLWAIKGNRIIDE